MAAIGAQERVVDQAAPQHQAAPCGPLGPRALYAATLAAFSLLYTLAFFQGLEVHGAYPGNSFKAIHSESFPGDQFITGHQPTMVSVVYVAARAVGDLWLDDRFQFVVHLGLVWLALLAVDRLALLFGLRGRLERLAIVALLIVSHHFKPNVFSQLVPSSGSPTAYIHPLGLWLAVFVLQANRTVPALALSLLMGLVAVKNAWYPALIAGCFALRDRWRVPWRRIAVWTALGLAAVFGVYAVINLGSRDGPILFDLVGWYEDQEANPFHETGIGNYFYAALLVGAMLVPYVSAQLKARCRAFFIIALITLLAGGVYYTYAPDLLKIPAFQALAANRTAWWPQELAYVILGCYAVQRFDRGTTRTRALGTALLAGLYLLPVFEPGTLRIDDFFLKRTALLLAVTGALGLAWFLARAARRRLPGPLSARTALLLLPVVLTTAVYLAHCARTQRPHLQFLLAHGVMGNASSAKWVGVDAYVRTRTPSDASVLALVIGEDSGLHVDWTLRARTGRTMPVGHRTVSYMDSAKATWYFEQLQLWRQLGESWDRHDWTGVARGLETMGWPDYVIVPATRADWLQGVAGQPYAPEASIGTFAILRRRS